MDVRSFASNFLPFSKPIEETWLETISDASKVYIVGEGVTAQEYAHILRRMGQTFELISPKYVIEASFSMTDGFMIVACHHEKARVVDALENTSLVKGQHFETFHKLSRNRAVFDLRGGFEFSESDWDTVISYIKKFPSIGGIDIFINSNNAAELYDTLAHSLRKLRNDFHVKLSIDIDEQIELNDLGYMDVDLLEILVRAQAQNHFVPSIFDSVCKTAPFSHAHVVYIQCDAAIDGKYFSMEAQQYHPSYYDLHLAKDRVGKLGLQKNDMGFCVSRRMYPVFDGKLNLKLCSLYDGAARINISCKENKEMEYIKLRNNLCLQCKQAGIYRKL